MRKAIVILFFLICKNGYSQHEYSNNDFYTYFDLVDIVKNKFHSQILLSPTIDEFGWNGEYYIIKKNIFSINTSFTFKKLLPNMGNIWVPQSTEWAARFPSNGIQFALKGKYFFSKRKFLFTGIKISSGYFWTQNKSWPSYISIDKVSPTTDKINWVNNRRYGIDVTAGRKFVTRFLSEISVEFGYRFDHSAFSYQCQSNCNLAATREPVYLHQKLGFYHFQLIMAFDL